MVRLSEIIPSVMDDIRSKSEIAETTAKDNKKTAVFLVLKAPKNSREKSAIKAEHNNYIIIR